jgi:hypothetical protein
MIENMETMYIIVTRAPYSTEILMKQKGRKIKNGHILNAENNALTFKNLMILLFWIFRCK